MGSFVDLRVCNTGRENVAGVKGIWTARDFVPAVADWYSIAYDENGNSSQDWSGGNL